AIGSRSYIEKFYQGKTKILLFSLWVSFFYLSSSSYFLSFGLFVLTEEDKILMIQMLQHIETKLQTMQQSNQPIDSQVLSNLNTRVQNIASRIKIITLLYQPNPLHSIYPSAVVEERMASLDGPFSPINEAIIQ
ncbi:hypothetical protein Drorol1_Dr00009376, partial [Drosera rotundifolia]